MTRTLIAGFGNVLRGDDGFGVEVLRRLAARGVASDSVELLDVGTGGIRLAQELQTPYDRLIIVDATTRGGVPGSVYTLVVDAVRPIRADGAAHRDAVLPQERHLPARERLIWEDSEVINRHEEWVDSNFGVDRRGDALFLQVDGRAMLDFAEVTFENGQVQVVDFQERMHKSGLYELLNFADGRHVKTVRLLAKSQSETTKFTVFMKK